MAITREAARGAASGAMPWLLLAGVAVVAFLWVRSKWPSRENIEAGAQNLSDTIEDTTPFNVGFTSRDTDMNAPVFGACSTGIKYILNWGGCRSSKVASTTDVGILAPSAGGTPFADLVRASQPVLLNEMPSPVDHYSAVWNPAEVAALKAAHSGITDPLISSYNQVRQYDTNRYQVPGYDSATKADFYDPDTGKYLDISPYGWVVFGLSEAYLGDPVGGKMHNLYGQGGSFGGLTHELPGWL